MTATMRLSAVLAAFALLGATTARAAEDRSPYVPDGLTQTVTTTHFMLHYGPSTPSPEAGMSMAQYVNAGAADFEEAYSRLVTGAAGSPNAGLRAPTADTDGRTDVYLAPPKNKPGMTGGIVYRDSGSYQSSYIFLTPDLPRTGFRFRAAHEFFHVIQGAYAFGFVEPLFEGFASWASEFALPDIDPFDHNFASPWLPLDCTTADCGGGYWQWMFIQAQVEDYGPDFVTGYYNRYAPIYPSFPKAAWLLEQEIQAQSGGAENLSTRFAAYARDLWQPSRWTTGSVATLHAQGWRPASISYSLGHNSGFDTGWKSVSVDHLAARFLRVKSAGTPEPRSLIDISWTRPAGQAAAVIPLVKRSTGGGYQETGSFAGASGSLHLGFDPADVSEIVLPLVNDSSTADAQPFGYRIQLSETPEPPAPPRVALDGLRVSPSRFRLGRGAPKVAKVAVGTTFRFTLSAAQARVKFSFTRTVKVRHRLRRIASGSFAVSAKAGPVRVKFMGRLSKRRALKPGRYVVKAQASDSSGRASIARKAYFTLLPPLR